MSPDLTSNAPLLVNLTLAQSRLQLRTQADFDQERLLGELRFLLHASRYSGEDARRAMAAYLMAPLAADAVRTAITEVTIDGHVYLPQHFPYVVEPKTFGAVDVLFETDACGVYRERIGAGLLLPTHVHQHLDEQELVLSDGFLLQGIPVKAGSAHAWPRHFPHRYENPTTRELSFLCIDRPKFIPTDEVEVQVPVAELRPQPSNIYF